MAALDFDQRRLMAALREFGNWPPSVLAMLDDASTVSDTQKDREWMSALLPGQRRVVEAFVALGYDATYQAVAEKLGVHAGTVHRHIVDIKRRQPAAYEEWRNLRRHQLSARHQRALKRRRVHTDAWFRKKRRRERQILGEL